MKGTIEKLKEKFEEIKERGWISSHRSHDTGIGKTFEDLMGIEENNIPLPDLDDKLEIKTQRANSSSRITLFTKAPIPKGINRTLYECYGHEDENNNKKFHTTLISDDYNKYKEKFGFKLDFDEEEKKIKILVKNHKTNIINFTRAYYDYKTIGDILDKKSRNIAFIFAESSGRGDNEKFKFSHGYICLEGMSLDKFITFYKRGTITYDIRIGTYESGAKKGKYHDHGSGFRVSAKDAPKLYRKFIEI